MKTLAGFLRAPMAAQLGKNSAAVFLVKLAELVCQLAPVMQKS